MTQDTKELLAARAATHGDYVMTAKTAQTIKKIIRKSPSYGIMNAKERESLEMIACKIARILCGDPYEPDHWTDIAGYALLARHDPDA